MFMIQEGIMAELHTKYSSMIQANKLPVIYWKISPSVESSLLYKLNILFLLLELEKFSNIKGEPPSNYDFFIGILCSLPCLKFFHYVIGFLLYLFILWLAALIVIFSWLLNPVPLGEGLIRFYRDLLLRSWLLCLLHRPEFYFFWVVASRVFFVALEGVGGYFKNLCVLVSCFMHLKFRQAFWPKKLVISVLEIIK